ncbi:hypothetical protein D2Q93_06395 [Alicyclobacillaceae bacterium I2511]|nr:hypothetical protein D2Q93_06395 [Alicyclobacillaceae bacterium I2511]
MHPMIHATLWRTLQYLGQSIYAEQMFCSFTAEMNSLPIKANSSVRTLLETQNQKTSYYRNLAAGHLRRLLVDPGLNPNDTLQWVVQSLVVLRSLDAQATAALADVPPQMPAEQALVAAAKVWNRRRQRGLKYAARTLQAILPPALWQQGVTLGKQTQP